MTIRRVNQEVIRETSSTWQSINPKLGASVIGYEMDTRRMKVGDGITSWNALSYIDSDTLDGQHSSYFSPATHDHNTTYLGINATADNSDKLDGQHASYFSPATHDHDTTYLGINATADNSDKLDGHDSTYFASSDHTHELTATVELSPQVYPADKPTMISRGIVKGYSFPVFNEDGEELFLLSVVPQSWDNTTDITFGCIAMIDTSNTDKKFKIQLDWTPITPGDVVGTSTSSASQEVTISGTADQYKTYSIDIDIDHASIEVGDVLALRIRRVSASSDESTGEIILYGFYLKYTITEAIP